MLQEKHRVKLRNVLASHFPDSDNIKVILRDAGLELHRINLQGNADVIWADALRYARYKRQGKVLAVIQAARANDYPILEELEKTELDFLAQGGESPPTQTEPYYLGLSNYTHEDKEIYVGRDTKKLEALRKLRHQTQIASVLWVSGKSGTGKSSFVLAGLWPALEEYYNAQNAELELRGTVCRPALHPLTNLTRALEDLGCSSTSWNKVEPGLIANSMLEALITTRTKQPRLLIIDQAEELFSPATDVQQAQVVIAFLRDFPKFEDCRTHLIIVIKQEYLDFGLFKDLNQEVVYLEDALSQEELVEAIWRPLEYFGEPLNGEENFEPALVKRLAEETAKDSTYLPLLQITLRRLWREKHFKDDYYKNIYGSLAYALIQEGDDFLARYSTNREYIIQLFLALINRQKRLLLSPYGTQSELSLRYRPDEELFLPGRKTDTEELLKKLLDARLLINFEEIQSDGRKIIMYRLMHEKLLDSWGTLREEIEKNKSDLEARTQLEKAAIEWQNTAPERRNGKLLGSPELLQAQALCERQSWPWYNTRAIKNLIAASQANEKAAHRRRNIIALTIGIVITSLIAAVLLIFSLLGTSTTNSALATAASQTATVQALTSSQTVTAQAEANRQAEARRKRDALVEQANNLALNEAQPRFKTDLDLGLLLSREALRLMDTPTTRGTLLSGLLAQPQMLAFLHGHNSELRSVAFSPDGKWLASGGFNNSNVVIWDVAQRKEILKLTPPLDKEKGTIRSIDRLAFSPDGKKLAAAEATSSSILLWDLETRQYLSTFNKQNQLNLSGINSLAFSPDGQKLAAGATGNYILVWMVANPDAKPIVPTLNGSTGLFTLAFSPDGQKLAIGDNAGSLVVWEMATDQILSSQDVAHRGTVTGLAFGPDSQKLVSVGVDGMVKLWEVNGNSISLTRLLNATSIGRLITVAFSPDGRWIAAGGNDNQVRLWEITKVGAKAAILQGHRKEVNSLAFSPDSKLLASASADQKVLLWKVAPQPALGKFLGGGQSATLSVAFSPDEKLLASAGINRTITLWDVISGVSQKVLNGSKGTIHSLIFMPSGQTLISGGCGTSAGSCAQGEILRWDVASGQPTPLNPPPSSEVLSLALDPDGKILVAGLASGEILFWNLDTGQPLDKPRPQLGEHQGGVTSLVFSLKGERLASGSTDQQIIIWDAKTRNQIRSLSDVQLKAGITSLSFGKESDTLVAGYNDNKLVFWNIAKGEQRYKQLPETEMRSLVFSSSRNLLISTSATPGMPGVIQFWNGTAPDAFAEPLNYPYQTAVSSLAFSLGGNFFASGGDDGSVILWDMRVESWQQQACQIANRDLDSSPGSEWQKFLGDRPYQTCRP